MVYQKLKARRVRGAIKANSRVKGLNEIRLGQVAVDNRYYKRLSRSYL